MSLQVELLGSVVHRERTGTLTRSGIEQRRAARLLDALDGPATGCCITG
jgi:hypothetical protein